MSPLLTDFDYRPFGKSGVRGGVKISIANDTCACVV